VSLCTASHTHHVRTANARHLLRSIQITHQSWGRSDFTKTQIREHLSSLLVRSSFILGWIWKNVSTTLFLWEKTLEGRDNYRQCHIRARRQTWLDPTLSMKIQAKASPNVWQKASSSACYYWLRSRGVAAWRMNWLVVASCSNLRFISSPTCVFGWECPRPSSYQCGGTQLESRIPSPPPPLKTRTTTTSCRMPPHWHNPQQFTTF